MFARVAVNIPALSSLFDYSLPPELVPARVGCLVAVPFGKQTAQGVILELADSSPVENPKPILSLLDPEPVLTQPQIELAKRLAESTLNPLAAMVNLMIPAGLSQQADVLYAMAGGNQRPADGDQHSAVGKRLLALLTERGTLRGRQIDSHFAKVDWRKTAQMLVRQGVLAATPVLPPPRARAKYIRVAQLAVPPEEAGAGMESLGTKQTLARRQAALRFLIQQPEAVNLSWVYASSGCNLSDLQALEDRGLIRLFENEIFRDPLAGMKEQGAAAGEIELTPEQSVALGQILSSLSASRLSAFLLYGVTGSGKTEIYLRAAEEVVRRGRQVVVLVPEIALTPQTVRRFLSRFPGQVGLIHSRLSEGERYDTWRRARSGKLKVVIGARSALFAPLANIGLIVVDECHDGSYYQSEPPFYHAAKAAQEYARLCGAVCVLGSATPTVEQRYAAENRQIQKLELPTRVTESNLPPVEVIDMREELKTGGRGIFSRALGESLAEVLSRGEQAILFLNRRGAATYVFCRECGYALKCPNCDTPLTLHVETSKRLQPSNPPTRKSSNLLCHRCGYARQEPKTCPACGGKQIRAYGLGAEKVEAEVRAMFPQARVLRWDRDATRAKDSHEMILTHFVNHRADILVGTQMLAKGLDLPLVTLVGVALADVGLTLPDPFASERVFQILTQVAGRAGRSARGGKAIMQTFMPEHYAIQFAAKHDVDGFYRRELEYRRQLGYPPFMRLARLEYRHADGQKAEAEARRAAEKLRGKIQSEGRVQTGLMGPVPSFLSKADGIHRWQIVLRAPDPADLLRDFKLADWRVEIDPPSLL